MLKSILIIQGCLPDYRVGFFSSLSSLSNLSVHAGNEYFSESIKSIEQKEYWHHTVSNFFLFDRRAMWQSGWLSSSLSNSIVVLELNPRILSNWAILFLRLFFLKKTLLWGHYKGRSQGTSLKGLRALMANLSHGIAAYTVSDAEMFKKWNNSKRIQALGNACISEKEILHSYEYKGNKSILYVGRLVKEKKVDVLIKGYVKALKREITLGPLNIVGNGPEMEELKAIARDSGFHDHINFFGHISQGMELKKLYEDALVATSPGYAGLSVIQSMAHGVPMVVSFKEPHSPEVEACIENYTTFFVQSTTSDEWANALEAVTSNSTKWIQQRPLIAEFIQKNYTFEAMAKNFMLLVDEVSN